MSDNEIRKRQARRLVASVQDYSQVFSSPQGKRILWDLMKHSGFLAPATVNGDPYATHFNDGMRSMLLHILQKLNFDGDKIDQVIKEGNSEDKSWNIFNDA